MGKLRSYLSQVQDFIASPITRNVMLNDLYQEALELLFNDNKEPPTEAIVLKVFPQNQTTGELKDGEQQFQSAVLRVPGLHDCIPDPVRLVKNSTNGEVNNSIQLHGVCFSKEPLASVDGAESESVLLQVGHVVPVEYIDGVIRFGIPKRKDPDYSKLQFISEKFEDQGLAVDEKELQSKFKGREVAPLEDLVGKQGKEIASESLEAASKNPLLAGQKITNGKLPQAALFTVPNKQDNKKRPVQVLVEIADEFQQLLVDFKEHFGYDLLLTDTYRSFERQQAIKDRYTKEGRGHIAATPGTSPHGWGLAFDCNTVGSDGVKGFDGEIYKWLFKNAPKRGFWNPSWLQKGARNKKGKLTEEPWHWEVLNKKQYLSIFNAIESEQAE